MAVSERVQDEASFRREITELRQDVDQLKAQMDAMQPIDGAKFHTVRPTRPLKEVLASLDKHMLPALPGGPSAAQMVREDRDR